MIRKTAWLTCPAAMILCVGMTAGVFAGELETAGETLIIEEGSADQTQGLETDAIAEDSSQGSDEEAGVDQSDFTVSVWQGYMDGKSWTFLLDSEDKSASVAQSASDGSTEIISGTYEIDDAGALTVTSSEDGSTQTWSAETVSNCQTSASGEAGELTLAYADPNLESMINDYAWYTGLSEEGDSYTYGISLDFTKLIFAFCTPDDTQIYETEFALAQTGGGDGTLTGTASDADGNEYSFSFEMMDDNPLHVTISLNNEICEASAVEARVFDAYTE